MRGVAGSAATLYRSEGVPHRVKALREALAQYPDNLFLTDGCALTASSSGRLGCEYRAKLDAHPSDQLFLYLYGMALIGKDTPAAIDLLNQVLAKDPDFVFADWALLDVYSSPIFRNPVKVAESIRAFAAYCPLDVDVFHYVGSVEDASSLRELTIMFRRAVGNRSTVGVAAIYPDLWTAEFRVANPEDFGKLRLQVRKDMDRIRKLDPTDINHSRALAQSYKLLGDSAAAESLQTKKAPARSYSSDFEAFRSSNDFDAAQSNGQLLAASEQWVKDWPEQSNAWYWRLIAIASKNGAAAAEIERAGDALLTVEARNPPPWNQNPYSLRVAEIWEHHDVRLRDCIRLASRAKPSSRWSACQSQPMTAAPSTVWWQCIGRRTEWRRPFALMRTAWWRGPPASSRTSRPPTRCRRR